MITKRREPRNITVPHPGHIVRNRDSHQREPDYLVKEIQLVRIDDACQTIFFRLAKRESDEPGSDWMENGHHFVELETILNWYEIIGKVD